MLTYGGHKVQAGTYWDVANGTRVQMEQEGVLPGEGTTRYLKAPAIVMILAAPILGLVFAVFLPFIGIAMSVTVAAKKLGQGVASAAAGSMSFGWRPIEAYLTGRKAKKAERAKKEKKSGEKR